ncbi:MAG TPA: hypothetical protein VF384_09430 [Planctomycetota bacterium]
MLLGSRGRAGSRSSSKFADTVRGLIGSLFGRTSGRWREDHRRRGMAVPAWLASALALGCFVGGFVMGDHLGQAKGVKSSEALRTTGRTPELLVETDTRPLSHTAFIVSAFPKLDPAVAKARAKALSDYLVGMKLAKARPYWWSSAASPLWVVAVYFDGDAELAATRKLLMGLPAEVPDETFVHWRNNEAEWPRALSIQ